MVRMRRIRRPLATAAVIVLLGFLAVRLQDRAIHQGTYCLQDERTILLDVPSGPATWTRIGSVVESVDSVVIEVRELRAPLPGTGGEIVWLTVRLSEPLGSRPVIDASTGSPMTPGGSFCEFAPSPGA